MPLLKKRAIEIPSLVLANFWKALCENIMFIFNDEHEHLVSPVESWYLVPVKNLYVRSCYKSELNKLIELRVGETFKILYSGTSGIGKSAYLQYLMAFFVFECRCKNTQ